MVGLLLVVLLFFTIIRKDTCEAQPLGLLRPLVREIQKHFTDFGLEPEFISHNTMKGLSGDQDRPWCCHMASSSCYVSRWAYQLVFFPSGVVFRLLLKRLPSRLPQSWITRCPHRSPLFEGGVLVITHNRDFSESPCKEVCYAWWMSWDFWSQLGGRSGIWCLYRQGCLRRGGSIWCKIDSKKAKKISASDAQKVIGGFIFGLLWFADTDFIFYS